MKSFKKVVSRGIDWAVAGTLALIAAAIYFSGLADYAFPGESASLLSAWVGLEPVPAGKFPLMAWFFKTFGFGQAIAPICGVIGVLAIYHFVHFFLRERVGGEHTEEDALTIGRIGGLVAALVFMFTPAVREAATHLDPRLFDAVWALLGFSLLIGYTRMPRIVAWLAPLGIGVLAGFGIADTVTFVLLAPLYLLGTWVVSLKRGGKGYGAASLFLFSFLTVGLICLFSTYGSFGAYADGQRAILRVWFKVESSFVVPLFVTIPFLVALFSSGRAFTGERGWMQISFHMLMTLVSILALATPLSPSSVMRPTQYSPVVVSLFAAFTAGYLMAYWWALTRQARAINESVEEQATAIKLDRPIGLTAGGVFALIVILSLVLDFFLTFDSNRGRFADQVAEQILADMGERTWLVTDGTLDSHLRLAAWRSKKELNLICLQKAADKAYIEELAQLLEAKGMGGLCSRLRKYGIDTFLQDWFVSEKATIAKEVAVFGAPVLWAYADLPAVPELFFFGGDPKCVVEGFDARRKYLEILSAPKGWGSYGLSRVKDDLDSRRYNLRRHLGFVTCDLGCREQAEGRRLQNVEKESEATIHYDRAFDYYEFVLREIDADNVSALFNELELLERKNQKAEAHRKDILSALEAIKKDTNRRYFQSALQIYYGDLMNPAIVIRQGLAQVKGGRFGQGLAQIRRAIDLVPVEQRAWAELNILAPLYAEGRGENREIARRIYTEELEKNPRSRVALVGLARLAMLSGDNDKAVSLLEQATADAGDDPKAYAEIAMLRLMRNELDEAKRILMRATDLDRNNLKAWSLLAMTVMRQLDSLRQINDSALREIRHKELTDELEQVILPTMEKVDPENPSVLSVRAFVKMRKGGVENLEAAREDLIQVASKNPENAGTGDMILGLEVQLNKREDAERRALAVLRTDPRAPLANWVIGSLALSQGDLVRAETHLRISADAERPDLRAVNDLAELLRQKHDYVEAERYARQSTVLSPNLYVVWETLGSILLDGGREGDVAEAERCIQKACDMSKDAKGNPADPRMLISLARVQIKVGKMKEAKKNLRIVNSRIGELGSADRQQFENVVKLAQ